MDNNKKLRHNTDCTSYIPVFKKYSYIVHVLVYEYMYIFVRILCYENGCISLGSFLLRENLPRYMDVAMGMSIHQLQHQSNSLAVGHPVELHLLKYSLKEQRLKISSHFFVYEVDMC